MSSRRKSGRQRTDKVTISDVAERAGVSIATVSRVMNRIPTVDPELRQRVESVAVSLGYTPNAAARGLASGATRTVGVVVPDLENPYFHQLLKGIASAAALDGHHMLVSDSNENPEIEKELALDLLGRVDGLILVSPRMSRADLLELTDTGKHMVSVSRGEEGLPLPSVAIDSREGMVALLGHLVRLGHRRIVYLAGPELSWSNRERASALHDAVSFGVEVTSIPCGATLEEGRAVVDEATATGATAFVAYNDLVALGVMSALSERGVRIGADVSVTGFDDIPFSRWWSPSLTTVQTPQRELGEAAWALLHQVLRGERHAVGPRLHPELVIRESTGPPPTTPSGDLSNRTTPAI